MYPFTPAALTGAEHLRQGPRSRRRAAPRRCAGGVEHPRPRRACASRSAGGARSCACGASSPRRRRRAAPRTPAPCARSPRRPAAFARRTSSRGAGREHLLDPRVDPRVELLTLHHQPDSSVGWRRASPSTAPSPRAAGRARRRRSSSSARTRRWRSPGAISAAAHGARRASSACSAGGPMLARARPASARAPLGGRRAQAQLGERGPQVEAGPADDDRPPAGGEQPVDLGVGELGVLAGAEGGVEREERHQPVLEPGALLRGRPRRSASPARRRPEARRPTPPRDPPRATQHVGEGERDGGLADPGRAEQRDHLGAGGSRPAVMEEYRLRSRRLPRDDADTCGAGAPHRRDRRDRPGDRPGLRRPGGRT